MGKWDEKQPGMPEDTNKAIYGFFGENRWLSNFWPATVVWNNITFNSSEAAYQAAKSLNPEDWERIKGMEPARAKREGRRVKIRRDWDTIKIQVMYEICLDKFSRNEELKSKLLATGDKHIEETNWWGDDYWGVVEGRGENQLGKVLMDVRRQLK